MSEQKRLSLAGIGCGSRTRTYMKLAMEQKDRYRIAAAADPVKQRTEAVRDFAPEEERTPSACSRTPPPCWRSRAWRTWPSSAHRTTTITLPAGRPWSWATMSCWKNPLPRR